MEICEKLGKLLEIQQVQVTSKYQSTVSRFYQVKRLTMRIFLRRHWGSNWVATFSAKVDMISRRIADII